MRSSWTTWIVTLALAASVTECNRDPGYDVGAPAPAPAPAGGAPQNAPVGPVYRVPLDEDLPSIGDARALVTVAAFDDYECPYCRKAQRTLERLLSTYPRDLRIVVLEHPLPMHSRARPAAVAALAAAAQGRFEALHARLFAGALDDATIEAAAAEAGLDLARFDQDRADPRTSGEVDRAMQLASQIGVTGTPTFFVNGRRIVGAQPYEVFRQVVEERLAAARQLVAAGVRPSRVYEQTIASGLPSVVDDDDGTGHACDDEGCHHGKDDGAGVGEAVEAVPTTGAPARGPASASVSVVLFSDYECPFCARAEPIVRSLEQAHPGDVRVVFKNMPLPIHDHAWLAAKAALAAGEQGKYWEYHDALFAHPKALDRASLERYAADIGLDARRFTRDLDDARLEARLEADVADADALGVKGTPTLFVNGRRIVGAQPLATLESAAAKH
ncbi:MAG TPA: thioredoxin domain-containing protein [Polyangiaceae bacterium]|nr:thioredoxin domain-containing protein [Polyangiaceae bacterium]